MPEVWWWGPQTIGETLEFETDVRTTRSAEWRDSLKDATQFLSLGHTLRNPLAETMIETMRANALGQWLVPEWPNATIVTSTVSSGTTVLSVTVPSAYRVGQKVFVGLYDGAWEQAEVDSVGVSDITLTAGLVASYAGSSIVPVIIAPMILCIAPNGVEFQSTYQSQGLAVRFMSIDPVDLSGNPYPTHSGLPVVTDGRVPFQPLAGVVNQAHDLMASGFGAYALQLVEDFERRRGTVSWYDKGHVGRWNRRQFLHYLRGRDGEFWLPTGQNDLVLQGSVASGALSVLVKPVAANAAMIGRRIVLQENANLVIREVTGAISVGPNQSLSIAAPGVAFTTSAVVSLAVRSRLDVDQIDIGYQFAAGGLAAACSVPVVEVP